MVTEIDKIRNNYTYYSDELLKDSPSEQLDGLA